MRTVTYKLDDLKKVAISIGRADENEATRVQIDAGQLFAEYPAAVPAMKVISPAGVTYSREVTRDGDLVVWDVVDSDLAAEGYGEMQLTFTENSVKVKSAIAQIRVCRSIVGEGTAPDPVQDWLDEAEDVLEDVEEALGAFPTGGTTGQVLAKKSNDDYDTEWVNQGSGGTTDYTELENKPQIGGVTLTGDKSLHDLGAAAESDIPDVSGFYTKPSSGIPASDIAAGVIPDPEDLIDDTAGEGDTDKTWSADKLTSDVLSAIQQVSGDLEDFKDGMGEGEEIHLNLLDTAELTSETKYYDVSNAGALRLNSPSGSVTYSSYIVPVKENQLHTANSKIRYIIPLDSTKTPLVSRSQMIETSSSVDTSSYPGTKYLAVSCRTDNVSAGFHWILSEGDTPSDEVIPGGQALPGWCQEAVDEIETEIQALDIKPRKNRIYMLTDTSFSEEKKFTEFATSVKAKCMHLVVNLTSFTSVKVGLRSDAREVFYAQVTDSAVNLYDYNGGLTEHTASYSHGLTIGDNLSIDVYAEANTGKYYVCVGSDGAEYTTTTAFNIAPTGLIYPFASMVGSASFVQFSAECNTQRPIWMFGDSYLGTNNTARWAYYLVSREKDSRVMMDAFAGENSTSAYASLESLINSGVPDYIVWCLGMNDGGDTGTTPNATWMAKVNALLEICEANKIIPIFATIPTVPSVNNEGKNAWVRESGHQYIDFAKAVGASDQGVWFTGMLSSDNVHPSVTGAITLYHAALAGCPQFSQN